MVVRTRRQTELGETTLVQSRVKRHAAAELQGGLALLDFLGTDLIETIVQFTVRQPCAVLQPYPCKRMLERYIPPGVETVYVHWSERMAWSGEETCVQRAWRKLDMIPALATLALCGMAQHLL